MQDVEVVDVVVVVMGAAVVVVGGHGCGRVCGAGRWAESILSVNVSPSAGG